MIIVKVNEGGLERALKQLKKKYIASGVVKELRARQEYVKPSVANRMKRQKAVYRQKFINTEEQ
jgi:small subunit ribosomal protein S21